MPKLVIPLTVKPDSVPTLVIFGWALTVTVLAVVALSAVLAYCDFKFATSVVELIMSGLVPVVAVDMNTRPLMLP